MLLRLINDIMAISAMDANGLTMKPADIDFAKAFDRICVCRWLACGESECAVYQGESPIRLYKPFGRRKNHTGHT